jgi:predicted ribosomally synthesized peptide with SipW-like signal peptide
MKSHYALALLLALSSGAASAAWTEIETFEDGMRVFADPASVKRRGDTASLEHLVRWPQPQLEPAQPPYLSTKVLTDYDCVGKRERYRSSISYAGSMANGARVAIDDNAAEGWDPISAASMEEKLWQLACLPR